MILALLEKSVRLTRPPVCRFAFYLTKSQDVAEETVQEVFVKSWEKRTLLKEDTKLLAYIKTMAQNQITDTFRRADHDRTYREKILNNLAALQKVSGEQLLEARISKIYREALMQLSPQNQRMLNRKKA